MTYKINLPANCLIHDVFMSYMLKKKYKGKIPPMKLEVCPKLLSEMSQSYTLRQCLKGENLTGKGEASRTGADSLGRS